MSNALFLRNYLIIVGLILAVGWGLDQILMYYSKQDNTVADKHLLRGSFLYLDSALKQAGPDLMTGWKKHQAEFEHHLGYPVTLFELSDFSANQSFLDNLAAGRIITLTNQNDEMMYYRQLNSSDYVVSLGPVDSSPNWPYTDMMLIGAYHLFVAIALFFWLRPFSSDLHELRSAASRFGENNFSARVNVNQSSSIRPVADAFNAMAQRIEDLVSAHKELTQAVSHELKTPLARFKFSLEIISNLTDSEQRESYLESMKDDVRELDDLIAEMLSYAEFGAHHLQLNAETVNVGNWLQDCIKQCSLDALAATIELDVVIPEPDQTIHIDKHLMNRAVHNLVRNALRYAQHRVNVSLQVNGDGVMLRVDDDGPGIPEQHRKQIFHPFTRLDYSRNKQSGGHGLGLAITQKIAQQHGGTITVTDSALGGAGFQLEWPG